MTQTTTYQPGVCNIGPAEIRERRRAGWFGLVAGLVFLAIAFALDWAPVWRLLVVIPAAFSAGGFLQGAFHFCVKFGTRGLFNFGELGTEEAVHEAEYRRKDQRKAVLIAALSAAIAVAVAIVAYFLPW